MTRSAQVSSVRLIRQNFVGASARRPLSRLDLRTCCGEVTPLAPHWGANRNTHSARAAGAWKGPPLQILELARFLRIRLFKGLLLMLSASRELSRRGFDAVLDMKASRSMAALDQTSSALFTSLGLPHFALARFFSASRRPETTVLAGRFHREWSGRYVARRYAQSSTIACEMLGTSSSYTWSDVLGRRGINPDQARIWNEAADFGLTDGLFTPARWSDGSYAAVVLAGHKPKLDDPLLSVSAEILSGYYCSEARRLMTPSASKPILTPRQRECLAWVREGKSSAAIAEILGISIMTVDEHVAEASRRLGVRTRVQAAVEAALSGLID